MGKASEYILSCGSEREVAEVGEEMLAAWADLSNKLTDAKTLPANSLSVLI